jgi:hypothetical protein
LCDDLFKRKNSELPKQGCRIGSSDFYIRNSICFMCFWFGLEILRLVYKKVFYPPKKVAPYSPLLELEKKFFEIGRTRYQKKQNFALISKMCRSLEFGKREKNCFTEKQNFSGFEKFCKKLFFMRKNLGELLDTRVLHIFEISATFCFF